MKKLKVYIEKNEDKEFKDIEECRQIINSNMKEEFHELCIIIQQCLDNDKISKICQFNIMKVCYHLAVIEQNKEFLFDHFQFKIFPSFINYVYKNQMYSKELNQKLQQYIQSSVIICQELISYFAHVYPQTKDHQPSKFLIEYQYFKQQQRVNKIHIRKKQAYEYIKNMNIDAYYKNIKQQWKSLNIVQNENIDTDQEDNQSDDNLTKSLIQSDDDKQQEEENENKNKKLLLQELSNLQQQIDLKKKELQDICQKISQKQVEFAKLTQTIDNHSKLTSYTNQSNPSKIQSFSENNKSEIFDSTFKFETDKQYKYLQDGKIPLVAIVSSYPEKKKRILDGNGVFYVNENYLLARQIKIQGNIIDVAVYLKCIQNTMRNLKIEFRCDAYNEVYSNYQNSKLLQPEQQVKFEIRNIQKSILYQKDIKIELTIDSSEILPLEVSFDLKLTNIVRYNFANVNELIKEYQSAKITLQSRPFQFDYDEYPNGLMDVQKCIQNSIDYIEQARSLLVQGSINDQQFICKITLDEDKQAQIFIKKLQLDQEQTKRLMYSYIEALDKESD